MTGAPDPRGFPEDPASVAELVEALERLSPDEQRSVLASLQAPGGPLGVPLPEQAPQSRRRPRPPHVVTYRVRVDLVGTRPPLWRRLEVASDLFLDEVHEVLQTAFGWTDSHLHRFAAGSRVFDPAAEEYVCPFEADDPDQPGVPADEVRLDEVLADVGDRLFYTYDFGDDWEHTIDLEAVLPRDGAAPRAVCTGGRRAGPAEDCGGVHGYELIAAATDPTRGDHAEATAEFARMYGDEVDPTWFATTPFDRDTINAVLADLGVNEPQAGRRDVAGGDGADAGALAGAGGDAQAAAGGDAQAAAGGDAQAAAGGDAPLPGPLADLLASVRTGTGRHRLRQLIAAARLDEPVSVDGDTAARMVAAYTWLLERVGDDGIRLTGSGYLPPAEVEAAVDALGLDEEWIGKGNREHLTMPVLDLRESAQRTGLLRKHKGRLVRTRRGRALHDDPVALWWHLAEQTPPRSRDESETQAGLLTLVVVAARADGDRSAIVGELLAAIGWTGTDGTPITDLMAAHAAFDTAAVLRRLGALTRARDPGAREQPTAHDVAFARAALSTWPTNP